MYTHIILTLINPTIRTCLAHEEARKEVEDAEDEGEGEELEEHGVPFV